MEFTTMKKSPKQSVTDYVTKMKEIPDQLGSIGEVIEEEQIIRQIINGIKADDKWESFTTAMDLYMDMHVPDLNTLMGQLFTHDKDKVKEKAKNRKNEDEGRSFQANFASRGRARGRGKGGKQGRGRFQSSQPCNICGLSNHTTEECFRNPRNSRGGGFNRGGYGSNRGRYNGGYNNNNNNYYNNNYNNNNYQSGHRGRRDYNNYAEDQIKEDSLLIMNLSVKKGKDDDHISYIDSGCSNHVAGNVALLFDLEDPHNKHEVQTGDDTKHSVEKIGNVKTSDGNMNLLSKVLYVPTITKKLISVG
ncbi:hypothetical protein KP509_09G003800 [Ceratopteris richardii]|uniref:Retrovirus-related Pol polyprotein from transposon TNT 1-94-like beta-barrel domain-containing protein n=1 Tax=Ceratopteris richardii TaxID=49495 RepID=A0A8T2TZR5_CERRI|nr:hypothetical protein KP509_09G003800 [Ceratopteris richardii]